MLPELVVDQTRQERLDIHINVTFHKIPCEGENYPVMNPSQSDHIAK